MKNIFRRGAWVLCSILLTAHADPITLGCAADVDTCFSYTHTCEAAAVHLIQSAQKRLWLAAYGFTSSKIAQAIQAAHDRGVQVHLVLDKSNLTARYSRAVDLAKAGVDIRVDSRYAIMHHKFVVVDESIGLGSMNFTQAGDQRNAENFNIFHHAPQWVRLYEREFLRLYQESEPYCLKQREVIR